MCKYAHLSSIENRGTKAEYIVMWFESEVAARMQSRDASVTVGMRLNRKENVCKLH